MDRHLIHEECWRSSQRSHNSLPQLLAYGYWGASHVGQGGSYPIGQCVSENLARKCSGPRALVSDRPARRRPHCRGVSVQSKCGDSPAASTAARDPLKYKTDELTISVSAENKSVLRLLGRPSYSIGCVESSVACICAPHNGVGWRLSLLSCPYPVTERS